MESVTLIVEGMSCNHCVQAIEGSVGKLQGVSNVKVSLEEGSAKISYDASKVTIEEMTDVIEDQGYDVV